MEKLTYTVVEAAKALGIGRSKMYELVRSGAVPSITLGNRRLIPAHKLREFIGAPLERLEPLPERNAEAKQPEEVHYLVTIRRVSGPREANL